MALALAVRNFIFGMLRLLALSMPQYWELRAILQRPAGIHSVCHRICEIAAGTRSIHSKLADIGLSEPWNRCGVLDLDRGPIQAGR